MKHQLLALINSNRLLLGILMGGLLLLQYQLWFGAGGVASIHFLNQSIQAQVMENNRLDKRNQGLVAEINDLSHGQAELEEKARSELQMIKPGELYYQVISK